MWGKDFQCIVPKTIPLAFPVVHHWKSKRPFDLFVVLNQYLPSTCLIWGAMYQQINQWQLGIDKKIPTFLFTVVLTAIKKIYYFSCIPIRRKKFLLLLFHFHFFEFLFLTQIQALIFTSLQNCPRHCTREMFQSSKFKSTLWSHFSRCKTGHRLMRA